jgi:tyrosinase
MVGFHSFSALAAVASTITSMSLASPLTSESPATNSIQKRQNDFFVVHPIEDGGVQPRLNIRDLAGKSENKELWALYILAIKRLQAVDQKEKLSYYQVAGGCSRGNERSS